MKRLVLALLCASLALPAFARDAGQWDENDPAVRDWYRRLMQPDNPSVSCCGLADAYYADLAVVRDNKVYAIITDDRDDEILGRPHVPIGTEVYVPDYKLKWNEGNPTGHVIVFLAHGYEGQLDVLCYIQNGGV